MIRRLDGAWGQGTNPDVQHAHRVGQKRLVQGCENFLRINARILPGKRHSPFPHIHILKEEEREQKLVRWLGSKRTTVAIVMESPLSDMTWASFLLCNGPFLLPLVPAKVHDVSAKRG